MVSHSTDCQPWVGKFTRFIWVKQDVEKFNILQEPQQSETGPCKRYYVADLTIIILDFTFLLSVFLNFLASTRRVLHFFELVIPFV